MLSKQQAIAKLKKTLPDTKPSGKAFVYKNWYIIEMIGTDQDPNKRYLDSYYKINRTNGNVEVYSPILDKDIDPYGVKKV